MSLSDYCTLESHLPLYYTHPIIKNMIVIHFEKDDNSVNTGRYIALETNDNRDVGLQYFNTLLEVDNFRNNLILNGWKIKFAPNIKIQPRK